ncbi:MAG: S8 family peptidase [Cyclobacteriaceae bacterium]
MKRVGYSLLILLITTSVFGQKNEDWFNKDLESDGQAGASVNKVEERFRGREPQEIIVAVIDSGVDIDHEDLKDNIWVNQFEIAGNGVDDDKNGYIDDIHGWNFLGGKEGNVNIALYETTRIYRKLKPKYEGKKADDVAEENKEEYQLYLETKKETEKQYKKTLKELEDFRNLINNLQLVNSILETSLLDKPITPENVKAIEADSERLLAAKNFMLQLYDNGFVQSEFDRFIEDLNNRKLYHYNIDFDPRKVVGDNPDDPYEKFYGNNDVKGARADHGTHVAGIIGAVRNNEMGINGVAHNVKIMVLRSVPDGDERDKDIANAIIYAVDNGARIINMSFGKGHSPAKEVVDKAVRYAEVNDVLLIHSAGNSSLNIDNTNQFPNKYYRTNGMRGVAENWITVGASGREKGVDLPASFSNYGRKNVDIFAPGVRIYSTVPENKYVEQDGTSMAAPVVTGVAALILNYFPDLTAAELKKVLLESATNYGKIKVRTPDESKKGKKTKFKKLSATGKVVNAYEALRYAEEKYGKKQM